MNKNMLKKTIGLLIFSFCSTSIYAFESYVYDVTGRLTNVTYDDGSTISYVYDANGNRLSSTPTAAVNQVPVAANDSATTLPDTLVAIDVLANDTDSDGIIDATSVIIVADVSNGVTRINATTGVVSYTPSGGFTGADSFTYTVNDNNGETSNVATVNITIQAANQSPVANNDSATTAFETAADIDVLANDTDADGTIDATTLIIVADTTNGTTSINATTGVVTYTPNGGFDGADSFTYTVNDNNGSTSNTATVSITVEAAPANQAPTAGNDSATTPFETVVDINVLANDTDADGTVDATTVTIVTNTTNGTTNINATTGVVTYTPNAGFSGADSFTYTINDDLGAISNVATVSITIEAEPANQGPVANNDNVTTNFNTAVTISVLSNDTDADGTLNAATIAIGTAAQNGTTSVAANGQITYTPTTGFSGADLFTYTVMDDDGATSNEATVSITVNAAPPPTPPPPVNNSGGGGSLGFLLLLIISFGFNRRGSPK